MKEKSGGNKPESVETYNEKGLLTGVESYNADGTVQMRIAYAYHAKDQNTERIVTAGDGSQIRRLWFAFDENGRRLGYEEFDANNALAHRFRYEFGAPAGKIRVKVFDKNGVLLKEYLEDIV